jgi:hypothetical protein
MTLTDRKQHLKKTGKRICRDCNVEFEDCLEFFFANSHGSLNWSCKQCHRKRSESYRNKPKTKTKTKEIKVITKKSRDDYNVTEEYANYINLLKNLENIQSKINELIKNNTLMVLTKSEISNDVATLLDVIYDNCAKIKIE